MNLPEDGPVVLSAEDLQKLTIKQILAEAESRGYSINASLKADIISEFLSQQG